MQHHPLALVILDGFGYRKETEFNAVAQAQTPHLQEWLATYPHTMLQAAGSAVGLLPDTMGNSEVGHLTIGAGRAIPQAVARINNAIDAGTFFENQALHDAFKKLPRNATLHLIGLLSNAGVHSDTKQLYAYIQAARAARIERIVVHPFLDGRDAPPRSAATYLAELDRLLNQDTEHIGSVHGRYYAMDRDNHWDRTQMSYDVLTSAPTNHCHSWQEVLEDAYAEDITDEFILPTHVSPDSYIKPGDGVIFFNFRPDRARQLTEAFVLKEFTHFQRTRVPLSFFVTPTDYGLSLQTTVLFPTKTPTHTLKEVLSRAGKKIFSIAETEKYAHITYFLSGGKEGSWPHEQQVLIPSIAAKNYIQHPEMSAPLITQAVIQSLETDPCDVYFINYANADMVGHSGDFAATVKAIECLDRELAKLYDVVINKMHGTLIITADHGNAEDKWDPVAQQLRTAHTTNPVPFIYITSDSASRHTELHMTSIADIAPFLLHCLNIPIPDQMKRQKA